MAKLWANYKTSERSNLYKEEHQHEQQNTFRLVTACNVVKVWPLVTSVRSLVTVTDQRLRLCSVDGKVRWESVIRFKLQLAWDKHISQINTCKCNSSGAVGKNWQVWGNQGNQLQGMTGSHACKPRRARWMQVGNLSEPGDALRSTEARVPKGKGSQSCTLSSNEHLWLPQGHSKPVELKHLPTADKKLYEHHSANSTLPTRL